MKIDVSVKVRNLNSLLRRIERKYGREGIRKLTKAFSPYARSLVIQNFNRQTDPYGRKWKPVKLNTKRKASTRALIDTGMLRNSIRSQVINDYTVRIGSPLVYAPTHQYGAVIVPKRARALLIPLTEETRYKDPSYIRSRYKTFIALGIVWGKRGRRSQPKPLYLLKRRVRIPARPFLPDKRGLPREWEEVIRKLIQKALSN